MGNTQTNDSVGGYSMVYLPGFIRSRIFWSIGEAERLLGRPGDTAEVCSVIYMNYTSSFPMGILWAILQNLYREDQIFCDRQFIYWSLSNKGEGKQDYENFSTRFKRLHQGYHLDKGMVIRPNPETAKINLKELVELFKSNDEALW